MTVSVMLGLCLQAVAVWLVHVAIRGQWIRHVGAIFLLMAVVGHGLTEIMQWVWPGRNRYRLLVSQSAVDDWVLLVSAAILAYAVAFAALTLGHARRAPAPAESTGYVAGLRLRWLLVLIVPLAAATFQGRGTETAGRGDYLTAGIVGQYLTLLVAVAGAVVLVRHGTRWTIPVIVAQSMILVGAGTRSSIVIACALSLFGAALCGVRPPKRMLAAVTLVALLFTVAISASRATYGRQAFDVGTGGDRRIGAITGGVARLPTARTQQAVLDDFVYRFDCNSFGALILQGLDRDIPAVGLATVRNNLLLGVPSAINPNKLATSVETRNEEAFLDRRFGLNPYVDYLAGFFGSVLAYYGPVGMILIAILMGLGFAAAQSVFARRATSLRFLLAVGLTQCVLLYEAGPAVYVTTLRGALVLVAGLYVVRRVGGRGRLLAHPGAPRGGSGVDRTAGRVVHPDSDGVGGADAGGRRQPRFQPGRRPEVHHIPGRRAGDGDRQL